MPIDLEAWLARTSPESRETPPAMPVDVAVQEALNLLDVAMGKKSLFVQLADFEHELFEAVPVVAEALFKQERAWREERRQKQKQSLAPEREKAEELRADFLAAGRYLLRKNEDAQAELEHISEGSGVADLTGDLKDMAAFAEVHGEKLAQDTKLPQELPTVARAMSARLTKAIDDSSALEAQRQRNQLYWLLDDAVDELRAAARYLLRDDPKELAKVGSQYAAKKMRRSRSKKPKAVPA